MLDQHLTAQLTAHLQHLREPIELVSSLDDSAKSAQLDELLREIAACSDLVSVRRAGAHEEDARRPSFAIRRLGTDVEVRFAGIPLGHEFTSLVLALLHVGGHPPRIDDDVAARIRGIEGEHRFETFFSLTCQNCPDVVQALNVMSVLNPRIRHTAIDGALFPDEVDAREVRAVPAVFSFGDHDPHPADVPELWHAGRATLEELLAKLDAHADEHAAAALRDAGPFDVLVVGGGPAGAAAAIYAARKGIATGVLAERFGGQVLDTLAIENLVSVPRTEGPQLASALEGHVMEYDVDLFRGQRARALHPAVEEGGLVGVELESGVTVESRTVIVSTGARWRSLGVPGEADYRNRGVTFCPHCDGPLFKGKRVAVVGGGNSGVEAAIDLAGLVAHVTVVEFADRLKADAVLIDKLMSLKNVAVHTGAQTTEITGAEGRVSGLTFKERASGAVRHLAVEGVFVQIGLVPNTEWLRGTVELSKYGEILIDDRCATSLPGVFAAGDATTVPYKQIIIASGEGSKAALSAFAHLIRSPAA